MLLKAFRDFLEFELLELEISDALDETATETELLIASLVALDLFMSKLSSLSRCRVNWKLIKARHSRAPDVFAVSIALNLTILLNR